MKVIETNDYVVIQSIPNYLFQEIVDGELHNCEKYPKVFSRLYVFDTKEAIEYTTCEGQNIWRIVTQGNGVLEARCVKFSKEHINMDIFPTYELCIKEIQERNKLLQIKSENKNVQQILNNILLYSKIEDFDSLKLSELKSRLTNIYNDVKSII